MWIDAGQHLFLAVRGSLGYYHLVQWENYPNADFIQYQMWFQRVRRGSWLGLTPPTPTWSSPPQQNAAISTALSLPVEDGTVARAPAPALVPPVGLAAAGNHPDNVEGNQTGQAPIADNVAAVENGEETTVAQAPTDNNTDTVENGGGTTDTDKVM